MCAKVAGTVNELSDQRAWAADLGTVGADVWRCTRRARPLRAFDSHDTLRTPNIPHSLLGIPRHSGRGLLPAPAQTIPGPGPAFRRLPPARALDLMTESTSVISRPHNHDRYGSTARSEYESGKCDNTGVRGSPTQPCVHSVIFLQVWCVCVCVYNSNLALDSPRRSGSYPTPLPPIADDKAADEIPETDETGVISHLVANFRCDDYTSLTSGCWSVPGIGPVRKVDGLERHLIRQNKFLVAYHSIDSIIYVQRSRASQSYIIETSAGGEPKPPSHIERRGAPDRPRRVIDTDVTSATS
ncbi:hypothetical protein J6590_056210 [Homalodisca vitripennis]|nr:hypothetical protein J6590_056210 [Homalodisca vitripennis]